jgi:signal peptidase I
MNQNSPSESTHQLASTVREIVSFVRSILIIICVYVVIRGFIMQPFVVQGSSMEETFQSGDYLIVDELSYRFTAPSRGDVVVFKADFISQGNRREYYIKRIVGLPGDRVQVQNGGIKITNRESPEGFTLMEDEYLEINERTLQGQFSDVRLGENEYFVLGDNRDNSSDSRFWGVLKREYIVGKPLIRLFPFKNITVY